MKRKKLLITAIILVVIVGVIAVGLSMAFRSPMPAVLDEISGNVELNTGAASAGTKLDVGDSVKTGNESEATIIFFDSSILRLDELTDIKITQLDSSTATVSVMQENGRTWNKIIKRPELEKFGKLMRLGGVNSYKIESPTSVATVRGTAFSFQEDFVAVASGNVIVKKGSEEVIIEEDNQAEVKETITLKQLEKDSWITQNLANDEEQLVKIRNSLKKKYAMLISFVKATRGFTDEEIDNAIDDYLRGDISKEEAEQALGQEEIPEELL